MDLIYLCLHCQIKSQHWILFLKVLIQVQFSNLGNIHQLIQTHELLLPRCDFLYRILFIDIIKMSSIFKNYFFTFFNPILFIPEFLMIIFIEYLLEMFLKYLINCLCICLAYLWLHIFFFCQPDQTFHQLESN